MRSLPRAVRWSVAVWLLVSVQEMRSARAAFLDDQLRCSVCETQSPAGAIEDCCCAAEHVATANHGHFRPLLSQLVRTKFFRYFKVDMASKCLFWSDNFKCAMRDCAVGECSADEIPSAWRREDVVEAIAQGKSAAPDMPFACSGAEEAAPAPLAWETAASVASMSSLDASQSQVGVDFAGWEAHSEAPWVHQVLPEREMTYVDLLANPERYTGYQGQDIWKAVYEENCFKVAHVNEAYGPQPGTAMCLEERVFFRLLSGMHASVNTHIAREYKFPDGHWGANVDLYVDRVGRHPDRLHNLYFTYLFVMRAVVKAREPILARGLETGDAAADAETAALLNRLLDPAALSKCDAVTHGFDETAMFHVDRAGLSKMEYLSRVQQKRRLRDAFRRKFQNVTRILDCVGCDKCRVWGKLQVQGLGAAVNILFAEGLESAASLTRNELIALLNVFDRLAQSVDTVREMQDREVAATVQRFAPYVLGGAVAAGLGLAALWRTCAPCAKRKRQGRPKAE